MHYLTAVSCGASLCQTSDAPPLPSHLVASSLLYFVMHHLTPRPFNAMPSWAFPPMISDASSSLHQCSPLNWSVMHHLSPCLLPPLVMHYFFYSQVPCKPEVWCITNWSSAVHCPSPTGGALPLTTACYTHLRFPLVHYLLLAPSK